MTHEVAQARAAFDQAARLLPPSRIAPRVHIAHETTSTQDLARELCEGNPGLLVMALHQLAGRGRLGRTWAPTASLGLAATFVISAVDHPLTAVSLASGVAAMDAIARALAPAFAPPLALRWPNDVVERDAPQRKLAGVLIERAGNVYLVGIGINVMQTIDHWPPELASRAVSIRQVAAAHDAPFHVDPMHVAAHLRACFEASLSSHVPELVARWRAHNALRGQCRTFMHDNKAYAGVVEDIDPTNEVVLRMADNSLTRLPALTTSMLHDS
jgi:BirA family transcriptional regulator, biotin operon repressor / biotin---[acetyl-CoA-carboxylase] ligase